MSRGFKRATRAAAKRRESGGPVPAFTVPVGLAAVVVDDDEDMRALVAAVLRHMGLDVVEARHGLQVLDYVAHLMLGHACALPDLIVSDALMPGVNGLSLLEGLRGCGCDAPVIFMTAARTDAFRKSAERLGAAEVLEKPFDAEALRAAVLRHLVPPSLI